MATNRDLLKEAIADAKSVKDTAIANAKAALEEAFTPFLKEKLSAKLQEMEEDDEIMEDVNEEETESVDEISLEELLAELESDEDLNEAKGDEDEEESNDESEDDDTGDEEEESEEDMSIEDMDEDDLKTFVEDVIRDMVAAGELEANEEGGDDDEELEMEDEDEEGIEIEDDEEIDVNELLSEDEEVSLDELLAELGDDEMNEEVKEDELQEAMSTIQTLKNELNEINLLNSKLLYTNKLFRNKSLTESQKVKVLSAFDKATSKKESQLVYETLLESLKPAVKKSPLQEGMGSASRALGVAKSKPIIEDDAFSRMRELAFGKK